MTVERISFEYIREHWDSPISANTPRWRTDKYCIGGAFCQATGYCPEAFPHPPNFDDALISYNPNLSKGAAYRKANLINKLNDEGDFENAWLELEKAMTYDE